MGNVFSHEEYFNNQQKRDKGSITKTCADQHKCLPHLACINPTLSFVEYFSVFGQ